MNKPVLNYKLYAGGSSGMCNMLMSLMNAYIIADLFGLGKILVYHSIDISKTSPCCNLLGLFDFSDKFEFINSEDIPLSPFVIDMNLENVYFSELPDFEKYQDRYMIQPYFLGQNVTVNGSTLAFPSYIFNLPESKINEYTVDFFTQVTPKEYFKSIVKKFLSLNPKADTSIHIRRGDFLNVHASYREMSIAQVLPNISDSPGIRYIHSNDDGKFIEEMGLQNSLWVEKEVEKIVPNLTPNESGLVSFMIALIQENFYGSYFSTFSGLVQRIRYAISGIPDQKFIFSPVPEIVLENGKVINNDKESLWNMNSPLKPVHFWCQEWISSMEPNSSNLLT